MFIERGFDKLLAGYTRGLDFVLDHKRATLATFLITLAATVLLYIYIPKGFFPQQDTGIIAGLTDAPQDISFDEMVRRQHAHHGCRIQGSGRRQLRHRHRRQPPAQRRLRDSGPQAPQPAQRQRRPDHRPAAPAARESARHHAIPAGRARPQCGRPHLAHAVSIHRSRIRISMNSTNGRRKLLAIVAEAAHAARRRLRSADQQRHGCQLTIDRDQAARFGIQPAAIDQTLYDAFGQRQAAQYFTQANSYHVVLEITPSLQGDPGSLKKLYLKSPLTGRDGAAFRDDEIRHAARDLSFDQSSGAVSGRDAVLQSRARRGARRCGRCDQPRLRADAPARDHHRQLSRAPRRPFRAP